MSIAPHVRATRRHWLTVAVLSTLGALLVAPFAWQQKSLYRADLQAAVTFGGATQQGPVTDLIKLRMVRTYAALSSQPEVLRPVITELDLPYTTDQLADRITVVSPLNTGLMKISVADTNSKRAAEIANAIGAQLATRVQEARVTDPAYVPALAITQPATAPARPQPRWWWVHVIEGFLAGFSLGVGIAVFRYQLHLRGTAPRVWLAGNAQILLRHSRMIGKRISARFWGPGWY